MLSSESTHLFPKYDSIKALRGVRVEHVQIYNGRKCHGFQLDFNSLEFLVLGLRPDILSRRLDVGTSCPHWHWARYMRISLNSF